MPIFLCEKSFTQKINFKIVINKKYMVMETKKNLKSHKPNIPPHKTPALFTSYLLLPLHEPLLILPPSCTMAL